MNIDRLPRFVARPLVRFVKDYSGLNKVRRKRIDERKRFNQGIEELNGIVKEIKDTRADYLSIILTGRMSLLESPDFGKIGVNDALVRRAKEATMEAEVWKQKYDQSRIQYLSSVITSICGRAEINRIPAVVFIGGERVYSTPRFERMVKRLDMSQVRECLAKRSDSLEYNQGRINFVRDTDERISMGYFIPERTTKWEKVFKRAGETATKLFYRTLREIDGELSLT